MHVRDSERLGGLGRARLLEQFRREVSADDRGASSGQLPAHSALPAPEFEDAHTPQVAGELEYGDGYGVAYVVADKVVVEVGDRVVACPHGGLYASSFERTASSWSRSVIASRACVHQRSFTRFQWISTSGWCPSRSASSPTRFTNASAS